jgi:hypothetical protein
MSKEKLAEKFSMVFLVVAGTVVVLLGSVNSTLWVTLGVSWIFWGLAYLKKAYTKHLAVTLLMSGSILTVIGLNLAYATHQQLILAIGLGVLGSGICNLITYAAWEVKRK